ncbi:hypothetical protein AB0P40_39740 [Streptomyces sp. NPDC079189]
MFESRPDTTIRSVAADLGINPETLRHPYPGGACGEMAAGP